MSRQRYSTDLTDAQWQRLQAVWPPAKHGRTGRPRQYPLREVVNTILYQLRTGCAWRLLPHDCPTTAPRLGAMDGGVGAFWALA